jgi:TPR repeat protein
MKRIAIALIFLQVSWGILAQPSQEQDYQHPDNEALNQYELANYYFEQKHDLDSAIKYYLTSSDNGYNKAQYKLGIIFVEGYNGTIDTEKGIYYLELGSKNNSSEASAYLSNIYLNNDDFRNIDTALKYAKLSIDQDNNNADAHYYLGIINKEYDNSINGEYVSNLEKAAELGHPLAQFELGRIYVKQGKSNEAVQLLTESANQGTEQAQNLLGKIYFYGLTNTGQRDYSTAYYWFNKAADKNVKEAKFMLYKILTSINKGAINDVEKGFKYLLESSENGYSPAQYELAMHYKNGTFTEVNYEKYHQLVESSAKSGNKLAIYHTMYNYYHGHGIEANHNQAYKWAKIGAENGNTECMFYCGLIKENGSDNKRDIDEAKFWYSKSAQNGNLKSKLVLNTISL